MGRKRRRAGREPNYYYVGVEGRTWKGREGRRVSLACGVERQGNARMTIARRRPAGSVTCIHAKGGVGTDAPVLGPNDDHLHASRRRGRRSWQEANSVRRRMYVHCRNLGGWYTPVLDSGLDLDRDQLHASQRPRSCSLPVVLGFRLHETTTRGYPYPRC
jgi:hypothetical protein